MTLSRDPIGVDLHVEVRHLDYWWGTHGLSAKTEWEDVLLYEKSGEAFQLVSAFCICTPRHLERGLADSGDEPEELAFQALVRRLLREQTIQYWWYYAPPGAEIPEVPFEAERNHDGVKPYAFEVWHPADGVGLEVISECARCFCERFLGIVVNTVCHRAPMSAEEALRRYRENVFPSEVRFTDALVQQLCKEWGKPANKCWRRFA